MIYTSVSGERIAYGEQVAAAHTPLVVSSNGLREINAAPRVLNSFLKELAAPKLSVLGHIWHSGVTNGQEFLLTGENFLQEGHGRAIVVRQE